MEGKVTARYISFLIATAFFFINLCCSKTEEQVTEWKGEIEYEDGIKMVKNPDKPVFGEIRFELGEDLILGNEKTEDDIFNRIFDVKVDGDGKIYVLGIRQEVQD